MNRVFRITRAYRVPDGTLVAPFLNPRDTKSDLPWDLFDGFSIAAGEIEPHSTSKIHVMPFVTQVTFVLEGQLKVVMKDAAEGPYEIQVDSHEAVLTRAGTFFQLVNRHDRSCKVLYIVSPPYLSEHGEDGTVIYEDAVVLDYSWEQLSTLNWQPPELDQARIIDREKLLGLWHPWEF
jgi:mannose-6-phosphate isomerase-like protein (cupin superfamily)